MLCAGNEKNPPLVLLHTASCGSPIWYKNILFWSNYFCVYAIDLIGESSKSILTKKMKAPQDNAMWLDETLVGLELDKVFLCGLSIGGWNVENYIGWGSEKEEPLPNSIIKLFTISVMNMNSNASFPKWLKKEHLLNITMPILLLLDNMSLRFQ